MGLFKNIKNRLERRRVRRDIMGDIMDRLSVDASGRVVITERPGSPEQERAALSVSTLFRCVQLISNAIASIPVHHQRRADGVWRDADTTLERLLTVEPNYYISAYDFWRAAVRGMLLDGVSYIVPRRDDRGNITYLQLYLNVNVTVDEVAHRYTVTDKAGRTETLYENQIMVLRYLSTDGCHTTGPIQYMEPALRLACEADDETRARIKDGGAPRLILSAQTSAVGIGGPVETQLREVARAIDTEMRNRGRIIWTPAGTQATQVGATSADLQLQSVREFSVRDICRFYGVPPQYVGSDSASNYKSAEMASVDFMTTTLDPILRGIESELNRKLFRAGVSERVKFDRSARAAADLTTRARYLASMQAVGAYTVNDIRAREDLPPVPGGDVPLVSANLRNIGEIVNPDKTNNQQNDTEN